MNDFEMSHSFSNTVTLYHGSSVAVPVPEIRVSKFTKDFGWGFYCTDLQQQAKRWAIRRSRSGFLSLYDYAKDSTLRMWQFAENDEWLDFVVLCRAGFKHDYDIVEGPMADDEVWNYIEDFRANEITRAAFWELMKFKHPTHQISFHTERALRTLKYTGCKEVHYVKKKR